MSNEEKYLKVFQEVFDVYDRSVEKMERTDDDWDSILHMELINELEDTFQIKMGGKQIMEITSYSGGLNVLKSLGITFSDME